MRDRSDPTRWWQTMLAEELAHGRGFLLLPVFLGLGVILWFSATAAPPAWLSAMGPVLVALAIWTGRRGQGAGRTCLLVAGLVLSGFGLAHLESLRNATVILDQAVVTRLEGVVERREAVAGGRWRYTVHVLRTFEPVLSRPPERVALLWRAPHEPLASGTRIEGRVRLSPPSGPALPGLLDFGFTAYFEGTGAVGFFYGRPLILGVAEPPGGFLAGLHGALFDLRASIGQRIRDVVGGDAGAFAAAIVTDERRAISPATVEALRLAGLAHIVAISGLNMALAAGISFVGLRGALSLIPGFAERVPIKKIAALGALLLVTAYYLISGFGVSAERAYVMMVIMLASVLFDRPSISLHNVALAAVLILVLTPSAVLGASFQMSFAATVALVAGYEVWMRGGAWEDRGLLAGAHSFLGRLVLPLFGFAAGVLATSLIGMLSTTIFSLAHFHRLAAYGLAGNLAAMPLISIVVMPAGLVGMLLMPLGLDVPFLTLMGWALQGVIAIAETVAGWGGEVATGRPPAGFLPLASAGFLLLTLLRTRLRLLGLPLILAAVAMTIIPERASSPDLLVSEDGILVALLDGQAAATNRRRPSDFLYRQWQDALRIEQTSAPRLLSPPPDAAANRKAAPGIQRGSAQNKRIEQTEREPASTVTTTTDRQSQRAAAKVPLKAGEAETILQTLRRDAEKQPGRFVCLPSSGCLAITSQGATLITVEDNRLTGTACDRADLVIAPQARFDECRSGALLLSAQTLRRTGSLIVRFRDSRRVEDWRAEAAIMSHERPWSVHRSYDWRRRSFETDVPEPVRRLVSDSGG
ncbi:ComEC/Rec2 family competence protein [Rhizobium sp. RU35A]|uniref:ComEC/Rec2 family competence protein n=1 Tax=Rhizobium sp. RU35A TaxID=1907414 RepID=UPI001FCF1FE5|nr:ComEC/Rec2 family competence protein [Rhizobium sp. RU35A]